MKIFSLLFTICVYLSSANAQQVNYDSIMGTWEYKSPKGKNKLSYKFDVDKKFTSITERKENETKIEGIYEFDKKGDLDRLILTHNSTDMRTPIFYHFIKMVGSDTLKVQRVTDKQFTWLRETRRNTMTFIRKTEKTEKIKE